MKKPLTVLLVTCLALLVPSALPAQIRKKTETTAVAKTWMVDAKNYDGKTVETLVLELGNAGQFSTTAPFAAIPVTTGTAQGENGGSILLLVPPADVAQLTTTLTPKTEGKGGAFGDKMIFAKLAAIFRIVGGEPTLVKGGDAAALAKLGKPSELLAAQLANSTSGDEGGATFPKKDFFVSQLGKSGRAETQVVLDRLLPLINEKRKADDPKSVPLTEITLRRVLREGATFQIDDTTAKTTWRIVWK